LCFCHSVNLDQVKTHSTSCLKKKSCRIRRTALNCFTIKFTCQSTIRFLV
jgi:hypothetical protein